MPRFARRALSITVAGVAAFALISTGALAAAAATYPVEPSDVGTSPNAAWTVSSTDSVAVSPYVYDGYLNDIGLRFTPGAGESVSAAHNMVTNAYPLVDSSYRARLLPKSFVTGGSGANVDPATGEELDATSPFFFTMQNTGDHDATVYFTLTFAYGDDEDSADSTMTWECAFSLPAGGNAAPNVLGCFGNGDPQTPQPWTTTSAWDFTYYPNYPNNYNSPDPVSYAAGDPILGSRMPAVTFVTGFGFRVTSDEGTTVDIDDILARDQTLDFVPTTTTSTVKATTTGAAVPGSAVTITAAVAPNTATGTFTLFDGSAELGSGSVSNGKFALTTPELAPGSHSLSAVFTPADDRAYTASTSAPVTLALNVKKAPSATPPAPTTEALLADPDVVEVPATDFAPSGGVDLGALDPNKPLSGTVPWMDATDSFVDVYAYSTPILLGTFPVVNGQVQLTGLDLSALAAGGHHLVFVGQTSTSVTVLAVTVAGLLAETGSDPVAPLMAGAALLLLGAAAVLWTRRRFMTLGTLQG